MSADPQRRFSIDVTNPREMQQFSAACILAKHLQYAYAEAYFSTLDISTTPVSLWANTRGAGKDLWIQRAMEWVVSQDPVTPGRTIAHLPPNDSKVVAFISPSNGPGSAVRTDVGRVGEDNGRLQESSREPQQS